jgi:hypothetical protein
MTTTNESLPQTPGTCPATGSGPPSGILQASWSGKVSAGRRSWLLSGTAASLFITATRPRHGRTAHGHVMPAVTGYGG